MENTTMLDAIIETVRPKVLLTQAGAVELSAFPLDVIKINVTAFNPPRNRSAYAQFKKQLNAYCTSHEIRPEWKEMYALRESLGIGPNAPKEELNTSKGSTHKSSSSNQSKANQRVFCKRILDPIYEFHSIEKYRQEGKFDSYASFMGQEFPNMHAEAIVDLTGDTSIFERVPCGKAPNLAKMAQGKKVDELSIEYKGVKYSYSGTYDFTVDENILANEPAYRREACAPTCTNCHGKAVHSDFEYGTIPIIQKVSHGQGDASKQEKSYKEKVRETSILLKTIEDDEIEWPQEDKEILIWTLRYILDTHMGVITMATYLQEIQAGPTHRDIVIPKLHNLRITVTKIVESTKVHKSPQKSKEPESVSAKATSDRPVSAKGSSGKPLTFDVKKMPKFTSDQEANDYIERLQEKFVADGYQKIEPQSEQEPVYAQATSDRPTNDITTHGNTDDRPWRDLPEEAWAETGPTELDLDEY
jgi:hypothetical protein